MKNLDEFSGKRLCVAISGGVDSTALLHYLKNLEKEKGFLLSAVHCEHGIRGEESLRDAEFVRALCEEWKIPLFVFSEDCVRKAKMEKTSLETSARNFRYDRFLSLIQSGEADYIATAHHQADEAETVLFRLARGTSLSGVKGMEERRDWLLRPFLSWTKEQIVSYAQEHGLSYCVDSTNLQTDATRNKLRLKVLPALCEAVDGAIANLARFASFASEDDALLYEQSQALLSEANGKILVAFSDKKPLFRRACLTAIKKLGVEKDYTSTHLENLVELQNKQLGALAHLPKGVVAQKMREGVLFFQKKDEEILPLPSAQKKFDTAGFDGGKYVVSVSKLPISGTLSEPVFERMPNGATLRIDEKKLPKDSVFRFRREGDEIASFGGRKSLKKFFNEKKIPPKERAFLPLIASATGTTVYVVCGVEIAETLKITEETKNVLYITTQKK